MVNIQGLYKFRDFFQKYTDNYVLIGGTAESIHLLIGDLGVEIDHPLFSAAVVTKWDDLFFCESFFSFVGS